MKGQFTNPPVKYIPDTPVDIEVICPLCPERVWEHVAVVVSHIRTLPPLSPLATVPFSQTNSKTGSLWPFNICKGFPLEPSQMIKVLSYEALINTFPLPDFT
jgi:hypothetical protein